MSTRLTIASAISVLMMSAYVLLGDDAARLPFGPGGLAEPISAAAPALPDAGRLLPDFN